MNDAAARSGAQQIESRLLFAYALPAIPLAALGLPLYSLVPTYYTETLGVSIASAGWAILIVRLFDAVTDPFVGYAADRIRPKLGRRRLLFLLSMPLAALSSLMLYWPADGAGVWWLAIWGMLTSLGFTLAIVPYSAWGAELVPDYHGRTRLTSLREGLTLVGTLIAIVLPFAIGFEQKGFSGLAVLGVVVAVLLLVFGTLAVRLVPEPVDHTKTTLPLRDALAALAGNRPFLRLIAAFFLNGLANGIPATLFLYFVSARLELPDMRGPLLFLYFLSAIAGIPAAAFCARRLGKHRAWCLAMIAACAVFAFAPLLPPGGLLPFAAICVITGVLLGFDLSIPPSIQADVIDADTAVSGDQRSGFYFAAWGLATKLSLAAGVGLVFPLLGLLGFDPTAGSDNGEASLFALAVLYAWIPVCLKFTAIVLMWNFPLDEDAVGALTKQIGN
ncbi:MFS transporter [Pararhizobium gei]|uniref:MFS transporter n=1 Tax=Pararhizobium gei TaxID=1395951 RepID=UPI0023DC7635|nr:MFS transporter [Rhizobium gei]